MIVFPNCKINLGLNILQKRPDGYHDLETVFLPVPLNDMIEVIRNPDASAKETVIYSHSGLNIFCIPEKNLCLKAYHLLKTDFPQLPSIKMHVHKIIPMGAGLGGGSSNASFVLRLLNDLFLLGLTDFVLEQYAVQLGSDCPFFIQNQPSLATGKGEIMTPVSLQLDAYSLLLVKPDIHVNTAQAFSRITPHLPVKSIASIIQQPIDTWKDELKNDFEDSVFPIYPVLQQIKDQLCQMGAVYASMSGSGSCLYGIFEKDVDLTHAFPDEYFCKILSLKPSC